MLTSPTTITIGGVARSFEKMREQGGSSMWKCSVTASGVTDDWTLNVRHTSESPKSDGSIIDRHNFELIRDRYDATTGKKNSSYSSYFVVRSLRGLDPAGVQNDAVGLSNWAETNIAALVAGNS